MCKENSPTAMQSCTRLYYKTAVRRRSVVTIREQPHRSQQPYWNLQARWMAPVFSISMFCSHTMVTHETRYSVKIGMQSMFDMASSVTSYLLVSTHEKSLDHESGGRGSQTVRRLWPITDVLHLRTQLVKVQLCFVHASPYCYFLLFAVWSQLWGKLS
jgi:hypothetical protein